VVLDPGTSAGIQAQPIGDMPFVYVVAPHHPLAKLREPISDDILQKHRAIAVADSVQHGVAVTFSLLPGQDVLTVPTMRAKIDAQLRGLGGGFVPEPLARPHIERGTLVARKIARNDRLVPMRYAWRMSTPPGRALSWWLQQLESPATRRALLERHRFADGILG
jgi:DNA-binding transcriptional LysR family regulator